MDSLGYKIQNEIKKIAYVFIALFISVIIFLFGAEYEQKSPYKVIKTTQKIDPVLKITIKNDVSDTLFIYKKNNKN